MPKRKKIVAKSKNLRRSKFSFNHLILVALAFGLIGGLATWAALAAPGGKPGGGGGGGKTSGSLSVVMVEDKNNDGLPNHKDRITFSVQTSSTDRPFVGLKCWQGSAGVYNNSIGIFPTYLFDPWLTLDSQYWTDNQTANCTASLYYYNKKGQQTVLNTLAFNVAP